MNQEAFIKPSGYHSFLTSLNNIVNSHSTKTIKDLFENLHEGCRCKYRPKLDLLNAKIKNLISEELTPQHINLIKKEFNANIINICQADSEKEIIAKIQ